jgi:HSP20 family protein
MPRSSRKEKSAASDPKSRELERIRQSMMQEADDGLLAPFVTMQRQMGRLMEDTWNYMAHMTPLWPAETDDLMPKVKVWEDEDSFHLQTRLPHNAPENVQVSVHDNFMTIKWSGHTEKSEQNKGLSIIRSTSQAAHRTVMIPKNADADDAEAVVENGVLEVTMPKRRDAEQEGRIIPIRTAG